MDWPKILNFGRLFDLCDDDDGDDDDDRKSSFIAAHTQAKKVVWLNFMYFYTSFAPTFSMVSCKS